MDGVALLAHVRREAPVHALMLVVMAAAMASHSALASIAGAGVLVLVSVPCAALSRSRTFLRPHVLDLWAMALVLLVLLPWRPGGHHALTVDSGVAFAVVVAAWAAVRAWLGMRGGAGAGRAGAASGALTGAGLVAMALFCG